MEKRKHYSYKRMVFHTSVIWLRVDLSLGVFKRRSKSLISPGERIILRQCRSTGFWRLFFTSSLLDASDIWISLSKVFLFFEPKGSMCAFLAPFYLIDRQCRLCFGDPYHSCRLSHIVTQLLAEYFEGLRHSRSWHHKTPQRSLCWSCVFVLDAQHLSRRWHQAVQTIEQEDSSSKTLERSSWCFTIIGII